MISGRSLELAIARASQEYRRQGRKCILVKQETAMFTRPDGTVGYTKKGAPCDFIGAVDGEPWAIEAKMTNEASWSIEWRRENQREHLQMLHDNDYNVSLVIEFTRWGEIYRCPWVGVAEFLAHPWRKSLSVFWCRVNGLRLPVSDDSNRKVWFLDGGIHPLIEDAKERVEADRLASAMVSLDDLIKPTKRERAIAERLKAAPRPGSPGYSEYLIKLAQEGTERQLKTGRRKRAVRR